MDLTIKKVLIDNRGEIALRILKTCKRLNIGAVVAYASSDANSLPVRQARKFGEKDDRYGAVLIGGGSAERSYEDIDGVIAAAEACDCDAVHPGYGFLSEEAEAARLIEAAGLIFVGPDAEVIENVGNKVAARELATKSGVPVLPGSRLIYRYEEALNAAQKIGYPVVLKADLGGGGLGNTFVESEKDLRQVFEDFSLRNTRGFYVEKKLERTRHIELQVAADNYGHILILGERDCTAQRKSQKVIEEAPPVVVAPSSILESMRRSAARMAHDIGYRGIGTWEFLYDTATKKYYFLEVNPRIQVEHTVTEMTHEDLDIVEWQLSIASGEHLPQTVGRNSQYSMQLRLYGEDIYDGFKPSYGRLDVLDLPKPTDDLRVDCGYEQGDDLPAGFDSMIAKIIVRGETRELAREAAVQTLEKVRVSGVSTNRDFLLWLLNTPECIENKWWTTYIEDAWSSAQAERFRDIKLFIGDGRFTERNAPLSFDAKKYLQDIKYTRKGVKRQYSSDLEKMHFAHPKKCGFRYGIYQSVRGEKFVFGYWDFGFIGGSLGSEEGAAVADFFKLAHENDLPAVTITTSSGARQQEGAKALEMMDYIIAARFRYQPKLYINIYAGMNFGGVTVSLAESADISMALTGSKIGFAGPDLTARMMGRQNGQSLGVGAHSSEDAYQNRNIDLLVEDLNEARLRALDVFRLINHETVQSRDVFYQTIVPTCRYDRPSSERFVTYVSDLTSSSLLKNPKTRSDASNDTVYQKRDIVKEASRLSAVDFMKPENGLFDALVPLSIRENKGDSEDFVPIIGGLATLGDKPVLVLAQQTQKRIKSDGTVEKYYVLQRACDFRWALRKIRLANKLRLPIILFCDTTGGDASLTEEMVGVSRSISDFLGVFYKPNEISVPVISVNIGENGSGGGLTFGRPLDASADLENALTFVSTPEAQVKILTGEWPTTVNVMADIINQLQDSMAKGRQKLHQIDQIIPEYKRGVPVESVEIAHNLRNFLEVNLDMLSHLGRDELLARRFERVERAGRVGLE